MPRRVIVAVLPNPGSRSFLAKSSGYFAECRAHKSESVLASHAKNHQNLSHENPEKRWWLEGDLVFVAACEASRLAADVASDEESKRLQDLRIGNGRTIRRHGE